MPGLSFRKDLGSPPLRYRTPSPPRQFVEPISPCFTQFSAPQSRTFTNGTTHRKVATARKTRLSTNGNKSEARPGVMDAFASIALATKTHSGQEDGQTIEQWRNQEPHSDFNDTMERPSKRAKSEKAASPDFRPTESRPSTSYVHAIDNRQWEAELLLNFSQNAPYAIPVKSPEDRHQSLSNSIPSPTQTSRSSHPVPDQSPTQRMTPYRPAELFSPHVSADTLPILEPPANHIASASRDSGNDVVMQEATDHTGIPQATTGLGIITEPLNSAILPANAKDSGILERPENPVAAEIEVSEKGGLGLTPPEPILDTPSHDTSSNFLAGIEEAAKLQSSEADIVPTATVQPSNTTTALPTEAEKEAAAPSVCASCNFHPNVLTSETEDGSTSWISCDGCKSWFHFACAGFKNEREVRSVDKYRCRSCRPTHGPTTYVRKSARAHSAIDYAGLNEGVVKSSDENPEHHYIKPIKDGTIKFNQENFARMRPELITADYFEKGDGMREPIVIPAHLNPRPRAVPDAIPETDSEGNDVGDYVDILHDRSVLNEWLATDFEYDTVPDHGQDALDMVMPQGLTVRKVSELYGPDEKIEVIDVKSQNGEDKKWNMRKWVDYYESEGSKVVRNVISLEVSQSKLGRLIRRPKVVRDLDLQDAVWPPEMIAKNDFPKVQFYCLMSVADCFTDFHIDFGGSSVYYHILKGKKTFFFIPPHEKHLKKYEEWCNSPAQNWTFLGDQTKECYRVDLSEGDTMLIPAGWIHAVWTPEDSLVVGGNFLTRMHYPLQIRVAQIEKATNVARKFRYPHFQKLQWYAALKYMTDDPIPDRVRELLVSGQPFPRDSSAYLDFDGFGDNSPEGAENFQHRYYSKAELDGLPELARYLQRTALIAMGSITDGISAETRNAVRRSIPKGHSHGEPLDAVKRFALWYAWKRGNETIPHWAYPDYQPENGALELSEKKQSAATLRRLDREAAHQAYRVAPDRQSTRPRTQPQNLLTELMASQASSQATKKESPAPSAGSVKGKTEGTASKDQSPSISAAANAKRLVNGVKPPKNKRPACDACRKGRRACKHRDDHVTPSPSAIQTNGLSSVDGTPTKSASASGPVLELSHVEVIQSTPNDDVQSSPQLKQGLVATLGLGKPSGRTKACKDCRKSKVSTSLMIELLVY